jgi:GDP-mannose transporter
MVGSLNKLPIAISGMIFFDAPISFFSVLSVIVAFAAGLTYSFAKIRAINNTAIDARNYKNIPN